MPPANTTAATATAAATITTTTTTTTATTPGCSGLEYSIFTRVSDLRDVAELVDQELSEPYSVYTYRYFVYNWPQLCIMCRESPPSGGATNNHDSNDNNGTSNSNSNSNSSNKLLGAIVCKADVHKSGNRRGYIAMLVVDKPSRKHGIGAELVARALHTMADLGCDEAVLETELTNSGALRLCVGVKNKAKLLFTALVIVAVLVVAVAAAAAAVVVVVVVVVAVVVVAAAAAAVVAVVVLPAGPRSLACSLIWHRVDANHHDHGPCRRFFSCHASSGTPTLVSSKTSGCSVTTSTVTMPSGSSYHCSRCEPHESSKGCKRCNARTSNRSNSSSLSHLRLRWRRANNNSNNNNSKRGRCQATSTLAVISRPARAWTNRRTHFGFNECVLTDTAESGPGVISCACV